MILYSNGCSYTENMEVAETKRYPYLVAEHFGYELVANAIPGSCNERIIRCTIRDCLKLKERGEPITALIQLTFLHRTEYAGDRNVEVSAYKYAEGDLYESVKPDSEHANSVVKTWFSSGAKLHDEYAETTRLLSKIVGLVSFFEINDIDYRIYYGPEPFVSSDFSEDVFYNHLLKNHKFMDFAKFYMLKLTGETAKHPDESGMKIIADYFIRLLSKAADKSN